MKEKFQIHFLEESLPNGFLLGEIKIDKFKEYFESSTNFWSKEKYLAQWKEGIERIVSPNYLRSVLITSMYDPSEANFIFGWALYKEGNIVYFQNHLIMFDMPTKVNEEARQNFIKGRFYEDIEEREEYTEEGEKISQWVMSLDDITSSVKI